MEASRMYLHRLHMAAFGRFLDVSAGPFSPGLNVVYGKNESGKTTLNAFIGGVLFGWEHARGKKNPYRPENAERAGSLFFADEDTGEVYEAFRSRNADGVSFSPAEASAILEGIDKDTFSTMFALTSDELRGLEGATDVTSKLLTASSGLDVSPAAVLADLEKEIASYTSRSASAEHSFVRLAAEEEECKQRLARARAGSDALKGEYREYEGLLARRDEASAELSRLNASVERISAAREEAARLEASAQENLRRAQECAARLNADAAMRIAAPAPLFDEESEAAALAEVGRLASERSRLENRLDAARDNFARTRAAYEEESGMPSRAEGKSRKAIAVAAAALVLAGLGFSVYAALNGEPFASAVSVLVAAAGAICGFAAIRLSRRSSGASRASAAASAMNIARAVLESCEEEELMFSLRVKEALASLGLEEAHGSLERARTLVEASRERRLAAAERRRMRNETASLRARCEQEASAAEARKVELLARCGADPDEGAAALAQREEALRRRRDESVERMRASDARLGELKQILRAGADSSEYDLLKTQLAQIATRKDDAAAELAELLLARRALNAALDAWKSESVPATYRRASELFRLMTNGRWKEVRMGQGGEVEAVDAVGKRFEPRLLSMGTCQQLYLCLRIALLERAGDVGPAIPVLADDILVNFDDDRREGAVKALAELSRSRQVILFTCHKEILDTVRRYAADCTVVAL